MDNCSWKFDIKRPPTKDANIVQSSCLYMKPMPNLALLHLRCHSPCTNLSIWLMAWGPGACGVFFGCTWLGLVTASVKDLEFRVWHHVTHLMALFESLENFPATHRLRTVKSRFVSAEYVSPLHTMWQCWKKDAFVRVPWKLDSS